MLCGPKRGSRTDNRNMTSGEPLAPGFKIRAFGGIAGRARIDSYEKGHVVKSFLAFQVGTSRSEAADQIWPRQIERAGIRA